MPSQPFTAPFGAFRVPARRVALPVVLLATLLPVAPRALAQDAPADPGFVISRTVNPRIAYRGVPVEDNPVHTRATTFPAQAFDSAMDATLAFLVEDGELGETLGSGGIVTDSTDGLTAPLTRQAQMGLFRSGATPGAPLGAGASAGVSAGGAVRDATAGIGSALSGALQPALQGSTP
jgi:hypothetical protein